MAKFIPKEMQVEAIQFVTNNERDCENMDAVVAWIKSGGDDASHDGTSVYAHLKTGDRFTLSVGDWVLRTQGQPAFKLDSTAFERCFEQCPHHWDYDDKGRGLCILCGEHSAPQWGTPYDDVI